MGYEDTPKPAPFVVNEQGYPTEESVRAALEVCGIGPLADLDAVYGEKRDTLAPLIAQNCLAEHLVQKWPKRFTAVAIGAVTEAQES